MTMSRKHVAWAGVGLTLALFIGSPAVADDVELLMSNPNVNGANQPNVLFILDSSYSMTSLEETQQPYDYTTTYAGACATDRYYWTQVSTTPDCNETNLNHFPKVNFACQKGATLSRFSGSYTDTMAQYREKNGNAKWKWRQIESGNDRIVECWSDSGQHGDGVDPAAVYARKGTNRATLFHKGVLKEVAWGNSPVNQIYTVYDGNYLNWFADPPVVKLSRIDIVKSVVRNVMGSMSNINVGFMKFNHNQGGPVIRAIKDLDSTRAQADADIANMNLTYWTPLSEAMYESALYWRGLPAQYGANDGPYTDPDALRSGEPDGDPAMIYSSPTANACAKNFTVLLTDGEPTYDTDAYYKTPLLPNFTESMGRSSCTGGNVSGACLDDISEYLSVEDTNPDVGGDQLVTTYTVGFKVDLDILKTTAENSGGAYYLAEDVKSLTVALTDIMSNIFKRDLSFTAPSVSVNSFNRTRHLNDLFITVLRATNGTHWPGNLKKYTMKDGVITDALDAAAVDPDTGFFKETAMSYWTPGTTPDGPSAYAGGSMSKIPHPDIRKVYTNISSNSKLSNAVNHVSLANIAAFTPADFGLIGAIGEPSLNDMIEWTRGVDVQNWDSDATTTVRRQMGDSLHSQPATIVYGLTNKGEFDTVVYSATNDGYLHAVDANSGQELWSFIPKNLLPDLSQLYFDEDITYKHYGIDGNIVPIVADRDHNGIIEFGIDNAYLIFGMRRGGDTYYALDVTKKSVPKVLWIKTFPELGQTWSTPVVTKVDVIGATSPDQAVIIFGAGYDTVHDTVTFPVAPDVEGAGIFMIDLQSGAELWRAGPDAGADLTLSKMTRSFPTQIRVLDMSGDGYADRMYAVDVGGQLWRFDIGGGVIPSDLVQGGVIAQLGAEGQATPTAANTRRFYAAPDLAMFHDGSHGRTYLSINIGSGYRAHPLDNTAADAFYSLRDGVVFRSLTQADYDNYRIIKDTDLVEVSGKFGVDVPIGSSGWKFTLPSTQKIVAEAAVFNDTVFFVSLEPNVIQADPCQPPRSVNRVYRVNIENGDPIVDFAALDPNDPASVDAARVTELEQGGVAVRPIFMFPSPFDVDNCTGDECTPAPIGCFGLECFDPEFQNLPVRTLWSQNGVD